jgi:hypothetical protein
MTDWQALKLRIHLWLMQGPLGLPGWLRSKDAPEAGDFGVFDDPERHCCTLEATTAASDPEGDLARVEKRLTRADDMSTNAEDDGFDEGHRGQPLASALDAPAEQWRAALTDTTSERTLGNASETESFEQLAARREERGLVRLTEQQQHANAAELARMCDEFFPVGGEVGLRLKAAAEFGRRHGALSSEYFLDKCSAEAGGIDEAGAFAFAEKITHGEAPLIALAELLGAGHATHPKRAATGPGMRAVLAVTAACLVAAVAVAVVFFVK